MQKVGILIYLLAGITSANPCVKIINNLAPQPPALTYRINAYLQAQKDITGKSTYTAPTHAGIKLEIPLYDPKEKYQLKKQHLQNLNQARKLLADYLSLRYEVEEMKKYIAWQWQRVQAGIEYRKDIWKEQIKLKQKQGELQALTALLLSAGIPKTLLNQCYQTTLKEEQKP